MSEDPGDAAAFRFILLYMTVSEGPAKKDKKKQEQDDAGREVGQRGVGCSFRSFEFV